MRRVNIPLHRDSPLRHIPSGVWVLGFVSLHKDISLEIIHSLLPLFMMSTLGASAFVVGIIEGLAESLARIVKVFSGSLSDYLGIRDAPRDAWLPTSHRPILGAPVARQKGVIELVDCRLQVAAKSTQWPLELPSLPQKLNWLEYQWSRAFDGSNRKMLAVISNKLVIIASTAPRGVK